MVFEYPLRIVEEASQLLKLKELLWFSAVVAVANCAGVAVAAALLSVASVVGFSNDGLEA